MTRRPEGPEAVVRLLIAEFTLAIAEGSLEVAKWCISPYVGPRDHERSARIHEELAAEHRRQARDKVAKDIRAQNEAAAENQLGEEVANAGRGFKDAGSVKDASGETLEDTKNLGGWPSGWQFKFALPKNEVKKEDSDD